MRGDLENGVFQFDRLVFKPDKSSDQIWQVVSAGDSGNQCAAPGRRDGSMVCAVKSRTV